MITAAARHTTGGGGGEVRRGELRGGAEAARRRGGPGAGHRGQHAGQCQLPALPHRGAVGFRLPRRPRKSAPPAAGWPARDSRLVLRPGTGSPSRPRVPRPRWRRRSARPWACTRVNGHVVRLASQQMSVPSSVAGSVAGALGINQGLRPAGGQPRRQRSLAGQCSGTFRPHRRPSSRPRRAASTSGTTQPAFGHGYPPTVPDQVCGYKPGQFRSAYHVGSTTTGQGVTVAIIDAYGSATITTATRPGISR